jgi:MFS family permease
MMMGRMSDLLKKKQTGQALVWTNLLSEPLFTLYNLLAFILYKDLGASALQIALLTMLKPIVSILSFYWSAGLSGQTRRLKPNILWAGFLMRAPFLACLWIDSSWYVIAAAVNYMFFYRAALPAWMEIMRRNLGKEGRIFSFSSALAYMEGVVLALACGGLLDKDPKMWKSLFFGAALIGLLSLLFQARMKVEGRDVQTEELCFKELIIRPWRDSYHLMKSRPDFSKFQWGFMACGFGIMLIQPAIPLFAVDQLGISYLEMIGAISIAKGLGFALSSPVWARWMEKINIFHLASFVFAAIGLFPVLLGLSILNIGWLYAAYFWYGVGSGGSHLVWNMSGPIFAGSEESSRYTGVNVVSVGIRGALAPPMGSWLAVFLGPLPILIAGGILCFHSGIWMFRNRVSKETLSING